MRLTIDAILFRGDIEGAPSAGATLVAGVLALGCAVLAGPPCWWGQNALALYLLHLVLLGLVTLPAAGWWGQNALALILAIMTAVAWSLARHPAAARSARAPGR
ncbi:hypothetical protein [Galbitalea soli]|uniref:Uncharacterized protein n=1 Tax=Galbitalea soli TaxID=1268042 RepID=A0A7C9PPD8_9MICO|nr:hypothetical protein [Galbitalea soli]NEM92293.1 hypothetical protein [Galbitalea soli]NYJ31751.1 fucose 4-O-acetylase-like acetyltransferase [Galbitalea soli]